MFIKVVCCSRNLSSLIKFLNFLNNVIKTKLSFSSLVKIKSESNTKKRITVLKSPHVNKSSQETFETKTYKKVITLFSFQHFTILMILKKLQYLMFSDVKISTHISTNSPKNLMFFNLFKINNKGLNYISIIQKLDVMGELSLKKIPYKI